MDLVRSMKGEVRVVSPTAIRWELLESGTKIFYQDKTVTNLLKRTFK